MSDKIRLEGTLRVVIKVPQSGPSHKHLVIEDIDGRWMELDAAHGGRYKIALEPVEPEPEPIEFEARVRMLKVPVGHYDEFVEKVIAVPLYLSADIPNGTCDIVLTPKAEEGCDE